MKKAVADVELYNELKDLDIVFSEIRDRDICALLNTFLVMNQLINNDNNT